MVEQKPLDKGRLLVWLEGHHLNYASGVAYDGQKLQFSVRGYQQLSLWVWHGDKIVYDGSDFDEAIEAYNYLL